MNIFRVWPNTFRGEDNVLQTHRAEINSLNDNIVNLGRVASNVIHNDDDISPHYYNGNLYIIQGCKNWKTINNHTHETKRETGILVRTIFF